MSWRLWLVWSWACVTHPTYVVEGVVVEVHPTEVVLDHGPIAGFMGAMTMPFAVAEASLLDGVRPGHRVIGRIRVEGERTTLEKLRVVGSGPAPAIEVAPPLAVGQVLPATAVTFEDGSAGLVGAGQGVTTAITFLYTRCPVAERCPATAAKLQALQAELPQVRLVAVTLDPERDTGEVLTAWGRTLGADPARWRFARLDPAGTRALAVVAGLPVAQGADGELVHELRWLVVGGDGRLLARFESNDWTVADLAPTLPAP